MSASDSKVVLVLGAYGEAGSAVVRGLAATKLFKVVGAGRDQTKLTTLRDSCEGLSVLQLDVYDRSALENALRGAGLVINCVGPYVGGGVEIARAALEAHVAYFDLASEQEHYRRLLALDDNGRQTNSLILTGVGAYPGLSGIMLKALLQKYPNADSGEMALVSGQHVDPSAGAAQAVSGVIELAYDLTDLKDGQLRQVAAGSRREFDFPRPFGATKVMRWPQMEVLSLASAGSIRNFGTFVTLGGEKLPSPLLLQILRYLRPTPGSRVLTVCKRVLGIRHSRKKSRLEDGTTNQGSIVIVLRENGRTHTASAQVNDLPAATAWFPVYAAKQWAAGQLDNSGVAIPMDIFEPDRVLSDVRQEAGGEMFVLSGI